jgi:squalene-associated FAD-dependent desaturase
VVVGGGFAGMAAAMALRERGWDVLLLDRRGVLGGRATSFRDAQSGEDVDNGTHLMVGGYTATLDLVRRAGAGDLLWEQDRLRLDYVDDRGPTALRCPPLPAPLHLLAGLLSLRVPWRTRWEAARFALAARRGAPGADLTLAEHLRRTGQSAATRKLLWDPLATAILNETPENAAAVLFHNVFCEAFLADRRAARLVFLRRGWGVLFDRLAAHLETLGGVVRRRALATAVDVAAGRATGVRYQQRAATREEIRRGAATTVARAEADAVVLAVPWGAVGRLLPEEWAGRPPFAGLDALGGSPIVSVELWVDRPVVDRAMVGLRGGEMEWVFDKGRFYGREGAPQHLAFIVSAARRSLERANAELTASAEASLRRYFPAMRGARVTRALVLREPSATFASRPGLDALRPGAVTPLAGLYLAGDWTDTGLPAVIEGAVRSGRRAALAAAGSSPVRASGGAPPPAPWPGTTVASAG